MVVATPRVLALGYGAVTYLIDGLPPRPDVSAWPHVPPIYLLAVATAMGTFFLSAAQRIAALLGIVIPLAVLRGTVDLPSVAPLVLFVAAAFAVVRLPIRRVTAGLLMVGLTLATLALSLMLVPGAGVVRVASGWATLVPMLWYSVYEHERHRLTLRRFLAYMSGRLFSAPVFTYGDVFATASGARLLATRWAGVRAIYIALLASFGSAVAARLTAALPPDDHSGAALLALSYARYVGAYCEIVIRFNLVIGVLRLFGIPVRDNFRYWLLARTPNEHWQRWNVLFREWIVTFIFFPIMRSRRWLFAAVMAALLTSGLLHIVPALVMQGVSPSRLAAEGAYWFLNGLAIYTVLKVPQLWPGAVDALGLRTRRAWSIVGIILTSAFYSVLYGVRAESESWAGLADYTRRLVDVPLLAFMWCC